MIRIKVCKLSEIINAIVIYLIYFLLFAVFFKASILFAKNMNFELAKLFIVNNFIYTENKFVTFKEDNLYERLIFAQIPKIKISKTADNKENVIENKNLEKIEIDSKTLSGIENETLSFEKLSSTKLKVGSVKIENYTKKELDSEEIVKALSTKILNDSKVLIYHTHASESYSNVDDYSDYYRTTNEDSNVISVGKKLVEELQKYNITAEQDVTLHDYLSYGKAYEASLKTIEKKMDEENYEILIDIHRDALAANETFRPTAEINGETVAKLMFVVGTNTAGLKHDEWIENLKFAIAFQERANRMYPGLFRDIHLSTSRYNQHMSDKAIILEVGATGNTLEEAQASMKYFAAILNSMK